MISTPREVRIIGAGLSGLSAAINLASEGRKVRVYEKRNSVGEQSQPNFQLLHTREKTVPEYLSGLNLKLGKFALVSLSKAIFSTRSRDIEINLTQPYTFVCRGGGESLEHGLHLQALDLGAEFEFNSGLSERDADIVAYGPCRRPDEAAYGEIYEGTDFPRDRFLMMYDDRYSPKGWYLYIVPHSKDRIEVINGVSRPHIPRLKKLYLKAIRERKILRDFVGDRKPVGFVGGVANVHVPKTAVVDGRFYVGEAAGFQDPFRGFGMNYALESGKFAAEAMLYGRDYDLLWKKAFMPQIKLDFSRRLAISILGDRIVDFMYRNVKSGDTIDFVSGNPGGTVGEILKTIFYNAELMKRKITGNW